MADELLTLSDRILSGDAGPPDTAMILSPQADVEEIADGVGFATGFSNVIPFATADGLVLVDTSSTFTAKICFDKVRRFSPERVDTAVYTHGHVDHVGGIGPYEEEAAGNRWAPLTVVAHEAVRERFDRYALTAGWNSVINRRQFAAGVLEFPTSFREPDKTYRESLDVEVGGKRFELHHSRGETDDHTWIFEPESKTLCPGDLIIWCVPNAGNPQKVQRYARDWADGLRSMAALQPEVLAPSHGLPVAGREKVRMVLDDTATLLESLHDQTVALMNDGARLNDIVHDVKAPAELLEKPYLAPIYDDPEFIVRNVYRFYGGWYDGNPAELKPARFAELAAELASLAGGAQRLAERAEQVADAGDLRLAGHLAELAASAEPESKAIHSVRAEVNSRRQAQEPSLMAKGVFGATARESAEKSSES